MKLDNGKNYEVVDLDEVSGTLTLFIFDRVDLYDNGVEVVFPYERLLFFDYVHIYLNAVAFNAVGFYYVCLFYFTISVHLNHFFFFFCSL